MSYYYESEQYATRSAECVPNIEKYGDRELDPQHYSRSPSSRCPSDDYPFRHSPERVSDVSRKRPSESTLSVSTTVTKKASATQNLHSPRQDASPSCEVSDGVKFSKMDIPECASGSGLWDTLDYYHAPVGNSTTKGIAKGNIEGLAPGISNKVDPKSPDVPGTATGTVVLSFTIPESNQKNDPGVTVKCEPMELEDDVSGFDMNVACSYSNGVTPEGNTLGMSDIGDPSPVSQKLENGGNSGLRSLSRHRILEENNEERPGESAVARESMQNDTTKRAIDSKPQANSNPMVQGVDKALYTVVPLVKKPKSMVARKRSFKIFHYSLFLPRPQGTWKNWSDEDKINAVRWFGAHPEDLTPDTLGKREMPEPHLWPVFVDGGWKIPDGEKRPVVRDDGRFAEIFEWNAIGSEAVPEGGGQAMPTGKTENPTTISAINGTTISTAPGTEVDKLKAWCARLGLSSSGKKTDLVDRLYTHYCSVQAATCTAESGSQNVEMETRLTLSSGEMKAIAGLTKGTIERLKTFKFKCTRYADPEHFGKRGRALVQDTSVDLTALLRMQEILKSEKPLDCPECHESFTGSSSLIDHFRHQHTEYVEELLSCLQCGYQCHKAGSLRKHLKRKHSLPLTTESRPQ